MRYATRSVGRGVTQDDSLTKRWRIHEETLAEIDVTVARCGVVGSILVAKLSGFEALTALFGRVGLDVRVRGLHER